MFTKTYKLQLFFPSLYELTDRQCDLHLSVLQIILSWCKSLQTTAPGVGCENHRPGLKSWTITCSIKNLLYRNKSRPNGA